MKGDSTAKETAMERRKFLQTSFATAVPVAVGCTSGHGISGALQLALSSWIFAPTFFGAGVVAAFLLYGKKGAAHV